MSIKKNYFYNILLTASNVLAPLFVYPYVLRILGPEGIGKVHFAMSVMGYFLMIAQLGIPLYGIKEIAKVRDNKDKLSKVFSELFFINLLTSVLVFTFYLFIISLVPKFKSDFILFAIVGINILINLFTIDWFYSGLEEYKYITLRSVGVRILYIIAIFIVIHDKSDYIKYALLIVLSLALANSINMIYLLKKINLNFANLDLKKYLKPIMWIFFAGVIGSIYNKFDIILLGFITDDKYVGFYTTNRRITSLIIAFVSALGTVLIPRLSYYINNNMQTEYKKIAEKSLNFIYFLTIPSIIILIMLAKEILLFFGGEKFLPAILSLQLLSLQILATSLATFFGFQVILANNDEKSMMLSNISGAIVNIILNLLLIKKFLHNAPSFAIVVSEFAVVATQIFLARKYINFNIINFKSLKYFFCGFLVLVFLIIIKSITDNFLILIFLGLIFSMAIYFTFLLIIKDDIALLIMDFVLKKTRINYGEKRN